MNIKLSGNLIRFFIGFLILILSESCSEEKSALPEGEKIILRLHLEQNDKFDVQIEITQNGTEHLNGASQVFDQSINATILLEVIEAQNGIYKIDAGFRDIQYVKEVPLQGRIEINSNDVQRDTTIDSNYTMAIEQLLHRKITITIDSLGKILDRTFMDQMKFDTSSASARKPVKNILGEQTTSKHNLELLFPFYPKDSVTTDAQWPQEINLDSELPMSIKKKYTVESIGKDTIVIKVLSDIVLSKGANLNEHTAQKTISGNQTEKLIIDRSSGWPMHVEIFSEIKVMERIGLKIIKTTTTTIKFNTKKL